MNEIESANMDYNNLYTMALWQAALSIEQVIFLKENRPNFVICHGQFRNVIFEDKGTYFLMYTKKLK